MKNTVNDLKGWRKSLALTWAFMFAFMVTVQPSAFALIFDFQRPSDGVSAGIIDDDLNLIMTSSITTTGTFFGDGSGLTDISATPSGSAGGDLTGTYPNPTIAALAVTSAKLAANSVDAEKVAFNYAGSSSEGGAATTATALAANGTNCSVNEFNKGVDASGNAESCAALGDADIPNAITVAGGTIGTSGITLTAGTAPTAEGLIEWNSTSDRILVGDGSGTQTFFPGDHTTAGHSDGANCSAGSFPLGVDENGAVQSCSTNISGNAATSTDFTDEDTLGELNTRLGTSIADGAHTTTLAASAITAGTYPSGTFTYTDPLTIRGVFFGGLQTNVQICSKTCAGGVGACEWNSSTTGDVYRSTGTAIGQVRNGRTGAGACL